MVLNPQLSLPPETMQAGEEKVMLSSLTLENSVNLILAPHLILPQPKLTPTESVFKVCVLWRAVKSRAFYKFRLP